MKTRGFQGSAKGEHWPESYKRGFLENRKSFL